MTLREHIFDSGSQGDNTLLQAIDAVFSDTGQQQKSVLNADQIVKLAIAQSFADKYNIPMVTKLCVRLMELKVSESGRGRTDMIAAIQQQAAKNMLDARLAKQNERRVMV